MLGAKDKKFYIIVGITVMIMFGFGYLPTFGQVTELGMKILGIFLGCIFAWCFGELVWSSILGLVALSLLHFGTMNANYVSAFANGTTAMMIAACVFCYAIQQCGLLKEISNWIIGQKWAQKSPWTLVFAFYLAAMIGGAMATTVLPPLILLWALFYEMAGKIGIKPYSKMAAIMLLGIGICGYVGVCVMPYSSMTVLVKGTAESFDPTFNFHVGYYMLLNLILAVVFLAVLVLVLRLVVGRKAVDFEMPKAQKYKMQLDHKMKWCAFYLLILVSSMLLPNLLPEGNFIKTLFSGTLGILGTLMLLSVLMMVTRVAGEPVLDIVEGIKNVPWPLLLLMSTALATSGYINSDEAGVIPTIVTLLNPLVEGKSAIVVTLMFVAFGLIMTNFINDMVTCVVLFPIAAQFIVNANGSVMLFAILFAQVTIQGCFMPSGSFVGAMFHGNSAWMRSKDVFKYVAIMEGVLLVVMLIVTLIGSALGV